MEFARSMFCSSPPFPPKTHHWNTLPSSSSTSVLMLREQASPTVASWSSSISAQNFPTSVLLQEQRDEYRPLLHMSKEDKSSQAILNTRQMDMASVHETNNIVNTDQVVLDFRKHLHLWPRLQSLLTSPPTGEIAASSTLQHVSIDAERPTDGVQCNGVSLAKKALSGSKHASSVVEDLKSFKADDDSIPCGKNDAKERLRMERKINEEFDQNDPLRSFLWAPETKQLLTLEQESQLIAQIQDLLRLEELKTRLQSQFGREPTMAEWAEGAGLNCRMLHAQLRCGNRSREKLIQANLRMVVHVAKTYQGRGLSLQDLLQEGSMGLMKSVEKFNPLAGCRFGNYAFWWIRQAIRKAVFRHSRTIRLPEKVYILLGKVMEAKKLYIQEGNLHPTKEELARRVGITVERIDNLLFAARVPISMQQTVWADQDTTFQEITADTTIEATDVSVEKQLMRRHVLNVLSILLPKERRIIRLRYGFEDGQQKSLSEIGDMFGLSRERVRQLEIRALYKLKKCLKKQGLEAYVDLLI
ncbi:RNA polymerase sigma factor sigF, chloroplastic-like isoform X3 [Abrus precatorius]|uniref:RNA polymerase sigma factor sigF, chloroplastic-like isoform X3 n=1 Tax=Abrus precatorius TaxID=3816 RepID=A0A8B8M540_ABRPR|nr:RNA polymerase sigma factor sigF, chloroplastic-like isoform X3 [Abrus precatorius]